MLEGSMIFWLIAVSQLICLTACGLAQTTGGRFYEGPGVFPGQILRRRGFMTQDYNLITKDNYQIRLTRAWNPLIIKPGPERPYGPGSLPCDRGRANKIPIIFIHGILASFNEFLTNSFGVKAKDFSNISLAWETANESLSRLAGEPSAKSLPMLALNHGHEIWLMSRRGFPGSRTQIGNPLTGDIGENSQTHSGPVAAFWGSLWDLSDLPQYPFSFNRRFWNFSLDQQAQYDMPQVVDFVLENSCRKKLSVVGHSAGGAITLMTLSLYPEMNEKIQNAIFWSEGFNVGHGDKWSRSKYFRSILEHIQAAMPPTFLLEPFQGIGGIVCSFQWLQKTLCSKIADLILGPDGGEEPLKPEFLNSLLYSSSTHEVAQLMQCASKGNHMHQYDYGARGNRIVHGHPEARPYNLSRITLDKMSFWSAATDTLVTPADVDATRKLLRVPTRAHFMKAPFNHQGYFLHKDVARLVIIPTLREIQQFSERNGAE